MINMGAYQFHRACFIDVIGSIVDNVTGQMRFPKCNEAISRIIGRVGGWGGSNFFGGFLGSYLDSAFADHRICLRLVYSA